jgi:hypothetical protein
MLATFLVFPLAVIAYPKPGMKTWQIAVAIVLMIALGLYAAFLQL